MIRSIYTKGGNQINKFYSVCGLLNRLPEKVPDKLKYKTESLDILGVMTETTENMETDLLGLFISSDELKSISRYLIDNEEDFMEDISVVCHSREKRGQVCGLDEADFAEVRICGKERSILIHANAMKQGKVGSYIEVQNTSWKKLRMYTSDKDKKSVILSRIIVEAALMEEAKTGTRYKTAESFLKLFNATEAVEPRDLNNVMGQNLYGTTRALGIYKMVYNKIKNDTLPVKQLAIIDNDIHVSFETNSSNKNELIFVIGMGKLMISGNRI